jgi:hypothetical protein
VGYASLSKGILLLLALAAVLFTFNHARLLARNAAFARLEASRAQADRVLADAQAGLLAELRRLQADPEARAAVEHGQLSALAEATRRLGVDPEAGLQLVSVDESLRVATNGTFKRDALWEATRGALEQGEASGVEADEESGALAIVAALRPHTDGPTVALALARPLDSAFLDAVKAATGIDTSLYTPDGIRRATTMTDEGGDRRDGEPAASALWRRWERRQQPFVSATVSRATAVDPIRTRDRATVAVREISMPLAYKEGFRRLPGSRRLLAELVFLGLAALMAALLARPARGR